MRRVTGSINKIYRPRQQSPIPLWEAILLGGLTHEQMFGGWGSPDTKTCAMTGALSAIGWLVKAMDLVNNKERSFAMDALWPFINANIRTACPASDKCINYINSTMVVHLNDDHKWTRKQISDWLRPIEEEWMAEQAEKKVAKEVRRESRQHART